MNNLIESIISHNYIDANNLFHERLNHIIEQKLFERKQSLSLVEKNEKNDDDDDVLQKMGFRSPFSRQKLKAGYRLLTPYERENRTIDPNIVSKKAENDQKQKQKQKQKQNQKQKPNTTDYDASAMTRSSKDKENNSTNDKIDNYFERKKANERKAKGHYDRIVNHLKRSAKTAITGTRTNDEGETKKVSRIRAIKRAGDLIGRTAPAQSAKGAYGAWMQTRQPKTPAQHAISLVSKTLSKASTG